MCVLIKWLCLILGILLVARGIYSQEQSGATSAGLIITNANLLNEEDNVEDVGSETSTAPFDIESLIESIDNATIFADVPNNINEEVGIDVEENIVNASSTEEEGNGTAATLVEETTNTNDASDNEISVGIETDTELATVDDDNDSEIKITTEGSADHDINQTVEINSEIGSGDDGLNDIGSGESVTTDATSSDGVTVIIDGETIQAEDENEVIDNAETTTDNGETTIPNDVSDGVIESAVDTPTAIDGETQTVTTETTTTTTAASLPDCTAFGNFAIDSDCRSYYSCSWQLTTNKFVQTVNNCESNEAFSPELGRCVRDVSYCKEEEPCLVSGSTAIEEDNTAYIRCIPRLLGGFHKYRIRCASGEIYYDLLGKCFVDLTNLHNFTPNFNSQPSDEDIIKIELKQFKLVEKAQLKQQKYKDKLEKKLQKELEKKAAKEAKEKAKAEEDKKEKFVCTEEGNFPSTNSLSEYWACVPKKTKLKAIKMYCSVGYAFDNETSSCVALNE